MSDSNDDIIIHPVKTSKEKEIPESGILFVNPGEANAALSSVLHNGGSRHFLHNSQLAVSSEMDMFIAGPAIGAPVAALVMEKLIALGARQIILFGWCGGVDKHYKIGDVVVPAGAVCGEGTSQYYCEGMQAGPSSKVAKKLRLTLEKKGIEFKGGHIWSTDAPYRESKNFLAKLHHENKVVGVDMEFSALCSVAAFRKIDFGALLIVSDEIMGPSWKPGFKNSAFKKRSKELVQLLLEKNSE